MLNVLRYLAPLLVFLGIGLSQGQARTLPSQIHCTHAQVCNLLREIFQEHPSRPQVLVTLVIAVQGDPHLFDPGMGDMKKLLGAGHLVTAPFELQPWTSKILPKRKSPTLNLSLPENILKKYRNNHKDDPHHSHHNHEALGHFWVYPDLTCALKNQLAEKLRAWGLPPSPVSCDLSQEDRLKKLAPDFKEKWIIFSHDALVPLFTSSGFQTLALKGSGHHDEVGPQSLKKIGSLLKPHQPGKKRPPIVWVLETEMASSSSWIKSQMGSQDVLISASTEGTDGTSVGQVLKELLDKFSAKGP